MRYDPAPFIGKIMPEQLDRPNVQKWAFTSGASEDEIQRLVDERREYLNAREAMKNMPEGEGK